MSITGSDQAAQTSSESIAWPSRSLAVRLAMRFVVCALCLTVAMPARADAYDAALTRAVAAKERALDVDEPARWQTTLRLFQQADAIRSTRETKYELAFAAQKLRQLDLAVEGYQAALELGLTGSAREKATAFVAEHTASMGRLELIGPEQHEVFIQDLYRGTLPLAHALVVFPGRVRVRVVSPEGQDSEHQLTLAAGELETLDLRGKRASDPAPATQPDPEPTAQAHNSPASPHALPEPPRDDVADEPAATPDTNGVPAGDSTAGPILVGSGVTLAATGGVLILIANQQIADGRAALPGYCAVPVVDDSCPEARSDPAQTSAQEQVDRIATWKAVRIGSWIGVGVGIVTLSAGIVLWAQGGGEDTSSATSPPWLPAVHVDHSGWELGWHGSF